jgi:hypothetical protein
VASDEDGDVYSGLHKMKKLYSLSERRALLRGVSQLLCLFVSVYGKILVTPTQISNLITISWWFLNYFMHITEAARLKRCIFAIHYF